MVGFHQGFVIYAVTSCSLFCSNIIELASSEYYLETRHAETEASSLTEGDMIRIVLKCTVNISLFRKCSAMLKGRLYFNIAMDRYNSFGQNHMQSF
ncbi:hypothetical protein HNY73_004973 [Argiope bruennichi]|uniref:Uncharacterized protein n=1 Tax=Argiope bruennichi TaxID=94029 RepID=A0A8T0FQW7_ARGBR|nr:hypothetical protein HNY73_004973 [Argiope bruennichi]